jgi:hypothetical protein
MVSKSNARLFFGYGQDSGHTRQDGQNKYVHAISNDGYWNDGSAFYLGRVLHFRIGILNVRYWQYCSNGKWADIMSRPPRPCPAFPTARRSAPWASPFGWPTCTIMSRQPDHPDDVRFAFYQADHPWEPWSYIGQKSGGEFIGDKKQNVSRWYGPSLSPKFIRNNPDGSATVIMTYSGSNW